MGNLQEAHGQFYGRTQRFFEKVIHNSSLNFPDFTAVGVSNRGTPPQIFEKSCWKLSVLDPRKTG
jgi:hypothetical protein